MEKGSNHNQIDRSGLSHSVICCGDPFFVRIFRSDSRKDWVVEIIDETKGKIVWASTAPDDALALINSISYIHKLYFGNEDQ